jgi:hypothetical protein
VKVSQTQQTGRVRLKINLYVGECLNPETSNMELVKGVRGRVLNPEMCNGAETLLAKGLGLEDKTQKLPQ